MVYPLRWREIQRPSIRVEIVSTRVKNVLRMANFMQHGCALIPSNKALLVAGRLSSWNFPEVWTLGCISIGRERQVMMEDAQCISTRLA
jgi:hypothetical protein